MFSKPRRPKRRKPLLDLVVYLAVRAVVCLAQMLTIRRSYKLADALAALVYRIDKRHRQVALDNLGHAFGEELTDAERDRIVRDVYRHFLRTVVEMLHIPRILKLTNWRDYIQVENYEPVIERLLKGGPMIMLTGHYGNWEMAGYLFGAFGFQPNSVARVLDNPRLERFLRSFRERTGQRMIAKKGGYDQMLEILNQGGLLTMLADQDAGPRGVFVDFFGRPASTFKAIALLAIEYQAPIVVGGARRLGDEFRYELVVEEIIEPSVAEDAADPVFELTRRYTAALERVIRRDPSQYFWLHRRWKHRPKAKGKAQDRRGASDRPAA